MPRPPPPGSCSRCPLAGAIIIGLGYKVCPGKRRRASSARAAIGRRLRLRRPRAPVDLQDRGEEERQVVSSLWDYAVTGGVDAKLSILVDPLSVLMMLVVTGVSTLIHLYSVAYMGGDRGYTRFFAYLNFFVFSMLLLVLAANFLLLIVGWAFVGAASYLLISLLVPPHDGDERGHQGVRHQRRRRHRPRARHVLHLQALAARSTSSAPSSRPRSSARTPRRPHRRLILLLVGAFAKSAQIPLHTWLPDAMEGPTPVSALIHAATMVTAGVYLIARMHPLFEQSRAAADVGAIIGGVTLLVAGTIGLVVTDLKRVIAYSTMSQIGYMIMAVSVGRLRRGPVPPDDARLLQGAAVHGGRLGHRGDGRRAEPRQDGRLPQGDAVHLRLLRHRRPRAGRRPAVLRASSPRTRSCSSSATRRLALGPLRRRLRRRAADRRSTRGG